MHPGLQQAEVRAAAAERDDLPVHDHPAADQPGEHAQLGIAGGDVLPVAEQQSQPPVLGQPVDYLTGAFSIAAATTGGCVGA
jgi:hypothetical protein